MVRQLRRYRRARVKARGRCLAILRRAHLRAFPWKNRRRWSVHSHLGLLKRLKLSALHPKTRLELIAVQLKKTRNSEPETEPPDPASVPHSVINHDPDSECPSPTDNNTQIVLRSSLNLSSVSQTFSSGDQGMSLSMTILSPPAPCIVYSNGQPLPDPSHLCNPVAPTIAVTRANQRQRQRKGLKSTMEGVSPLSRRPKRQSRCNIQFWCRAWRKWGHRKWRRARCLLWLSMFKAKRQVRARSRPSSLDTQSQKHTVTVKGSDQQESQRVQERRAAPIRGCGGQGPEDRLATAGSDQTICHLMGTSGLCCIPPQDQCTAKDGVLDTTSNATGIKRAVPAAQSKQASVEVSREAMQKLIYEFLDCFYGKYGSFIPLNKIDVMRHLSKKLNSDLTKRRDFIFTEVAKCQAALARRPMRSFRVVYNKHTLTLDDLFTLDNQNWLNDQVMNMYGELIMESAHHKVHFFNSFFHRQLMTKGYEGVKRWTKKVDLFSKTLLLVPIHLEIHWCLVTADTASRRIHLYDSQGIVFKDAAENILKYIKTEAKEKKQTAFQSGWTVFVHERIPQQTNENDCGVFVLEYCRCLALGKPLHFSQEDMPSVRKRIYKELCDCKLKG